MTARITSRRSVLLAPGVALLAGAGVALSPPAAAAGSTVTRWRILPLGKDVQPLAVDRNGLVLAELADGASRTVGLWQVRGGQVQRVLKDFPVVQGLLFPMALNARGDVVGDAFDAAKDTEPYGWLWPRHGAPVRLPFREAYDIADDGTIAGERDHDVDGTSDAVVWHCGRLFVLKIPGERSSSASRVLADGRVMGWSQYPVPGVGVAQRGIIWRRGLWHDMGTLGGRSTLPLDINEHGVVAGTSQDTEEADRSQRAMVWLDGRMTDVSPPGTTFVGQATTVNARGDAIGVSLTEPLAPSRAFLWTRGSSRLLPGRLTPDGPAGSTQAVDIDDDGTVVGTIATPGGGAVVWETDGRVVVLPGFGGAATGVVAVANGMVIGSAAGAGPGHDETWGVVWVRA